MNRWPRCWPTVAAAQAAGAIGAEHVRVIRRFSADPPAAVDIETRQACEATLARVAAEQTPMRSARPPSGWCTPTATSPMSIGPDARI